MTPEWVPPWRPGLPQAICRNRDCSLTPPRLCVAVTMIDGLCADCARRLGAKKTKEPEPQVQLGLPI